MHDSPQYALLQTIKQMHAEVKQRMQSLEALKNSQPLPAAVPEKLERTMLRVERLFHTLEKAALLETSQSRAFTSRGLQRSVHAKWDWLVDAFEKLVVECEAGSLSSEMCDAILSQLKSCQEDGTHFAQTDITPSSPGG